MKQYLLEFQEYEIENLLQSLRTEIQKEQRDHCKWEQQKALGMWWYTPNRRVKQLEFTLNSILRQYGNYLVKDEQTSL